MPNRPPYSFLVLKETQYILVNLLKEWGHLEKL